MRGNCKLYFCGSSQLLFYDNRFYNYDHRFYNYDNDCALPLFGDGLAGPLNLHSNFTLHHYVTQHNYELLADQKTLVHLKSLYLMWIVE